MGGGETRWMGGREQRGGGRWLGGGRDGREEIDEERRRGDDWFLSTYMYVLICLSASLLQPSEASHRGAGTDCADQQGGGALQVDTNDLPSAGPSAGLPRTFPASLLDCLKVAESREKVHGWNLS